MSSKFTLFWNGPFSQWHPSGFTVGGINFNCAEQFMMYCKARYFKDIESADLIMEAHNPAKQKKLGRKVKGFNTEGWNKVCKQAVQVASYYKLTRKPTKSILFA